MDSRWAGYLTLLAAVAWVWWWLGGDAVSSDGVPPARIVELLDGTFEDDAGHRWRLWFVDTAPVQTVLGPVVGRDGKYASDGVVGPGSHEGTWNFGSFDPVVLNLVPEGERGRFAQVEVTSEGMRLRVSEDPVEAARRGFLAGPEVRVLRRVGGR